MQLAKFSLSRLLATGLIIGANILFPSCLVAQQTNTNPQHISPVKVQPAKQTNSFPSYLTNQVHFRYDNSDLPYSKMEPLEMYTRRLEEGISDQLTVQRLINLGFSEREELFRNVDSSVISSAKRTFRDILLRETEFLLSAKNWAADYIGPIATGTITPQRQRDYGPKDSLYRIDSARVDQQKFTLGADLFRETPFVEGTYRNPSGNLELRGRVGKDFRNLGENGFTSAAADIHLFYGVKARVGGTKQFSGAEGSSAYISLFKNIGHKRHENSGFSFSVIQPERGDTTFAFSFTMPLGKKK